MNKVILIGNLGKDPELNEYGDVKVCSISIATNSKIKGEKVSQWHNIKLFNKSAELVSKYMKKGSKIAIEGELRYSKHEDKYYTEIVCNSFEFLEPKKDDLPY